MQKLMTTNLVKVYSNGEVAVSISVPELLCGMDAALKANHANYYTMEKWIGFRTSLIDEFDDLAL